MVAANRPRPNNTGKLRMGFTTGSAASAAAKAALMALVSQKEPEQVCIALPGGGSLDIPVNKVQRLSSRQAMAVVIKDAGDDPDVTHKAEIQALVEISSRRRGEPDILIRGGKGVGEITRPGLELPVGEPAINQVPREMIRHELREVMKTQGPKGQDKLSVKVEIAVPEGERLAKHTLNPRLGIVGGISIIGTTGLVKPFSHEAYTATIESGMSVARASNLDEVVLTTGGKSEKMAMKIRPDLLEQAFIQIADFYGFALRQAAAQEFSRVGLVVFFGKAVKQAAGLEYTHARQAPLDLAVLADWFKLNGAGPDLCQKTAEANTARQVLELLRTAERLDLVGAVGRRLMTSARDYLGGGPRFWAVIVDYDGSVLFESMSQGVNK